MRDFPSCFGENGVQVADSSSSAARTSQNLVTCVYQCRLRGRSCLITITWSKNLMGQGLSVGIDDSASQCLCKVDIKPWLFSKRKGSKSLDVDSRKVDVFWDLSSAKFGSGPEPLEGFYLAIVFDRQMVLLLGDLRKEALKKTNADSVSSSAIFVAKRENIFGKRVFCSKAQFCDNGPMHELMIECDTVGINDPSLVIRVDRKTVMQVKRLRWKFRGNHAILVDGLAVEVFWDVHNWLFGTSLGSAVFMFKTCLSAEKLWASQHLSDSNIVSWSHSQRFRDSQSQGCYCDRCNSRRMLDIYMVSNWSRRSSNFKAASGLASSSVRDGASRYWNQQTKLQAASLKRPFIVIVKTGNGFYGYSRKIMEL